MLQRLHIQFYNPRVHIIENVNIQTLKNTDSEKI